MTAWFKLIPRHNVNDNSIDEMAAQPAAQGQKHFTYPHRIASLKELFPQLPPTLVNLDLGKTINAGDVLDIQDVISATEVAKLLELCKGTYRYAVLS